MTWLNRPEVVPVVETVVPLASTFTTVLLRSGSVRRFTSAVVTRVAAVLVLVLDDFFR